MSEHTTTTHVSQSECNTAQNCGAEWLAKWQIGLRYTGPEGPAQRVGSLGHACLGAHVTAMLADKPADFYAAMLAESRKRHYLGPDGDWSDASQDLIDHAHLAQQAAHTLIASPEFNVRFPASSPLDPMRRPLIEQRLHAGWDMLNTAAGLVLPDAMLATFRGHMRKHGLSGTPHRLGMEGTPDIVHYEDDSPCATVFLDDYKMRTKAVDGVRADNNIADPQGAFYKVLLAALQVDDGGRRDVVFRQVNVYAGRWMTLEDFLDEGSPYVIATGLPTRNEKALPGMVTPEVWGKAWHELAERRRIATASNPKGPRLPTTTEEVDARRFLGDLAYRKAVQVSHWRLDHSVCLEVVRDMLSAVASRLAELDAGLTPGRNLRTWAGAPCVRPFGCDVKGPCLAALGSDNLTATFRDHLAVTHLRIALPEVGEHDSDATEEDDLP